MKKNLLKIPIYFNDFVCQLIIMGSLYHEFDFYE